MAPGLEKVLTIEVKQSKEEALSLNSTRGHAPRFIAPLVGCFLRGQGVDADFVIGGSDWVRFDTMTNTAYLDARLHFRDKNTKAAFFVWFEGLVRMDEKIQLVWQWSSDAATTDEGDHYFFVNPVIEVSDSRHKWMEQTAFVAQGHYVVPGDGSQSVGFDVYKLVSG